MAVLKQKMALTLALIFATNFLLTESTVTTTTKFDSYIGITDKLKEPAERLRIFEAVWGEIRAEGAQNLTQVKVFYDALLKGVNSTKVDEQQQTAELSATVRGLLVVENAQLLSETLNPNKSQDVLQVQRFRETLYMDYSEDLLTAIFERAIDIVYPYQRADELYDWLDAVDSKVQDYYKQEFKYRVRVNWTLYLHYKFIARGEINDKYVYNTAKTLHNFKKNVNMYKTLDHVAVRRIDTAFNSFTPSLRHLFNTTNVCLENYNFANYYLYFPISQINGASAVQAVLRNVYFDYTSWTNSFASSNQLIQPDQFYLQYEATSWLLYRRTTDRMLIVQRDSTLPNNRWWTPALRNDRIMFENLGYYMCATSDYNNALQGFNVQAVLPKSLDDPMCQWRITNCAEIM